MNIESGMLNVGTHDRWAAFMVAQWLEGEERRLGSYSGERCKLQACALQSFRNRLEAAAELPPSQTVVNVGIN
jgi:hypothetical protein